MIDNIIKETLETTAWEIAREDSKIDALYSQKVNHNAARSQTRILRAFKDFHTALIREQHYQKKLDK